MYLDDYFDPADLKAAISNIRQVQGDTNTAAGLEYLEEMAFRVIP